MSFTVLNIVLNNFENDSRVLKEGLSFLKAGYVTKVVALHERDMAEVENVQGLSVDRIKLRSRSWIKWKPVQVLKYFEFSFRVLIKYYNGVDVVHCHDLNALPIGFFLKKISKKDIKIVYDAHEYETETNGLNGIEKIFKKWLERFLIQYADEVITVSDSIADEYHQLYPIPRPKLVLNCPIYEEVTKKNFFREIFGIRENQIIFLYQGGLSKGRGIELILQVFEQLENDKIVLICMGYGALKKIVQDKSEECDTIFFHPAVKPEILLDYTSSADYGICFIEDTCLSYRYCLPNKMFEYLMAGLPVLTSNLFEMRRLVEAENVGVVAKENTVEGFKKAISASLNQDYHVIQKNVFVARKKYCWEEQESVLREIYREI